MTVGETDMLKHLINNFKPYFTNTTEVLEVRQRLQSLFFKLKSHKKDFLEDDKIGFKMFDESRDLHDPQGHITFYLGNYVLLYELNDTQSIQFYKRGKIDSLQFAELLAISFDNHLEYVSDPLFVKADFYQLEILINHVIKSKQQRNQLKTFPIH